MQTEALGFHHHPFDHCRSGVHDSDTGRHWFVPGDGFWGFWLLGGLRCFFYVSGCLYLN